MRSQLTKDNGFFNLQTDVLTQTCEFKVEKGFDFKAKLNQLAENSTHISGWTEKAN